MKEKNTEDAGGLRGRMTVEGEGVGRGRIGGEEGGYRRMEEMKEDEGE